MAASTLAAAKHPSPFSIVVASVARVLFATLLFTAAGMGVGLLLGILGTIAWGAVRGSQVDMRNAYLHVAIPFADHDRLCGLHRGRLPRAARPSNIPGALGRSLSRRRISE